MATWHQLQRPVQLWAENELTVVIDPPNEPRCLALFLDAARGEPVRLWGANTDPESILMAWH